MNNLTRALLAGVAFCALNAIPAVAESAGPIHVTALHGGRVVNKTKLHNRGATHITYTFSFYDYLSATYPLHKKVTIGAASVCGLQKAKVSPKKTVFGKAGVTVDTHSGCGLVEPTYALITHPNPGDIDTFVTIITSKSEQNGTKYKNTLNLDVTIDFQ